MGPPCDALLEVAKRVTVAVLPFGNVVASPPDEVLAKVAADVDAAGVAAAVALAVGSTLGLTGELSILPIATAPLMSENCKSIDGQLQTTEYFTNKASFSLS